MWNPHPGPSRFPDRGCGVRARRLKLGLTIELTDTAGKYAVQRFDTLLKTAMAAQLAGPGAFEIPVAAEGAGLQNVCCWR